MPMYDHRCSQCGHQSTEFVWITAKEGVICPRCGGQMIRLFTGTFAELKTKRGKPFAYSWEPQEWNATKDNFESAKFDFKRGKTDATEVQFWKGEVEKENPNQIV